MSAKALKHLRQADPRLAEVIARVGPFRLRPRRLPPHRSLSQSIIFQQLHGKAAETILKRFCALFPNSEFPAPKEVVAASVEHLRTAGLSRGKAAYLREVARHALEGSLPSLEECDALPDEDIIARLTVIKGVGRWTAEMFLMFNLGRPDVLLLHDLGLRRGFQIVQRKRLPPEPEALGKFGERWRPYRTVASWYLWQAADAEQ